MVLPHHLAAHTDTQHLYKQLPGIADPLSSPNHMVKHMVTDSSITPTLRMQISDHHLNDTALCICIFQSCVALSKGLKHTLFGKLCRSSKQTACLLLKLLQLPQLLLWLYSLIHPAHKTT